MTLGEDKLRTRFMVLTKRTHFRSSRRKLFSKIKRSAATFLIDHELKHSYFHVNVGLGLLIKIFEED